MSNTAQEDCLKPRLTRGNLFDMACSGDIILTNYEGSNDDTENNGTSSNDCGQSFEVPSESEVCAVSIFGGKGTVGTQPGTFEIEILSGSYAAGTVIATTGSINSNTMSDWTPTPAWYKFELTSNVTLDADTEYFIKCNQLTGSTNDVLRWAVDTTSPSYAEGQYYRDGSATSGSDRLFRVHGVEAGVVQPAARRLFLMNM